MSSISYYGPKDPGYNIDVQMRAGRDETERTHLGIAIRPVKGKNWAVVTWGSIAKHIDAALTDPAFRADILVALERTAPKPAEIVATEVQNER